MASNFVVRVDRDEHTLTLKLAGDFDRTSASQLIEILEGNRAGVTMAMIETSDLEHLDPTGQKMFRRQIHTLKDFCYRLVFTGPNASDLAPAWTDCF